MQTWIEHPLILEGNKVRLVPLSEAHFNDLLVAGNNEIIWQYMPVNGLDREKHNAALADALKLRETGEQFPFVVIDRLSSKPIGSTRFIRPNQEFKSVEIGWTWYKPEFWSKGYNEECKLLLLTYCFETLKASRVQLIAAEKNTRSRNAILRIGASFEGVLRDVVIRNEEKRSVAYYSILESEWLSVKQKLQNLIKLKS